MNKDNIYYKYWDDVKNYILKSKIEEKIEEYQKLYNNETENAEKIIEYDNIIKLLQDLLNEVN